MCVRVCVCICMYVNTCLVACLRACNGSMVFSLLVFEALKDGNERAMNSNGNGNVCS